MKALAALGAIVGIPAIMIGEITFKGFVLKTLWLWFFVPLLNLPVLGVAQAIGISLVVSFLTHQRDTYEDKNKSNSEKLTGSIAYSIFYPLLMLFVGYIVKMFM